jgi:hypothetical protein
MTQRPHHGLVCDLQIHMMCWRNGKEGNKSLFACVPVIIVKYSGVARLDEEEGRYRAADDSRVLIAL